MNNSCSAEPHQGVDNAFKVIHGDFVSTDDGTGIVHIAPTSVQMMQRLQKKLVCLLCLSQIMRTN